MICSERITLGKYLETYCQRPWGHTGTHSTKPDPHPQPVVKMEKKDGVAGSQLAAD